ncbi:MAG: hypothetical protein H7301_14725 [Cryobacterium sp.]|nr:hypothetical protein [Oligoflexia bacterium]
MKRLMSDLSDERPQPQKLASNWTDFETVNEDCHEPLLELGLAPRLVDIALSPGVLPRVEVEGDTTLILLRVFDATADKRAASTRELTRKLGIFVRGDEIITVHRFPTANVPKFFEKVTRRDAILSHLFDRMLITYSDALNESDEHFDSLEESVFQATLANPFHLREGYYFKRRLNIIRKILRMTQDMLDTLVALPGWEKHAPAYRLGTRKRLTHAIANSESLLEAMNHLLALQLAIVSQKTNEASQRTNEVMRVLTVFSAYFLPLSFIAGVYGMNFAHMPELTARYGYPAVLCLMVSIAVGITVWFRKRGWMDGINLGKGR